MNSEPELQSSLEKELETFGRVFRRGRETRAEQWGQETRAEQTQPNFDRRD